jgi:hypothetical protein
MLLVECQGCHTQAFLDPDADPAVLADPDAAITCPPGSGCCSADHHHGNAASACPGGHKACPSPDACPVWLGMQPHLENSSIRDTSAGKCPGGHCGLGVDGCTVCRPLKITLIPGSVRMQRPLIGG